MTAELRLGYCRVAVGHDQDFWDRFVATLARIAAETDLASELEEASLGRIVGLKVAVSTLTTALVRLQERTAAVQRGMPRRLGQRARPQRQPGTRIPGDQLLLPPPTVCSGEFQVPRA